MIINSKSLEDAGAVPATSTINTLAVAAPEMTYAGECKSRVFMMGVNQDRLRRNRTI